MSDTRHRRTAEFRAARKLPDVAVLEGFHAIKHAMRFGARIFRACTCDRTGLANLSGDLAPDLRERLDGLVEEIGVDEFAELAPRQRQSNVIALAARPCITVDDVRGCDGPVVLLEHPRHLGNIGAVVRVAAASNAAGVIVVGEIDPWHPTIIRAAAGLHFAVPVLQCQEAPELGIPIIAVDPAGDRIDHAQLPHSAILAIGTEQRGLSEGLLNKADLRLALPMRSGVSSLNLATATAIVLYSGWVIGRGDPGSDDRHL